MSIGKRIKDRREQLHMTADALGKAVGISRATIYRYENGSIEKISTEALEPFAKALHTTEAYLMGWTDDPHDTCRPKEDETSNKMVELNDDELKLVNAYRQADETIRKAAMAVLNVK